MTREQQANLTRSFVESCKRERDDMLRHYTHPAAADQSVTSAVALHLRDARLTEAQRQHVVRALDVALTDAFYTILLALDGAASLGGDQQPYTLLNQSGNIVSDGRGDLEGFAYEVLQSSPSEL